MWHLILEFAAIGTWVVLGLRARWPRELVCGAAFFLALYHEPKGELMENHTVMLFLIIVLFAVTLRALQSRRLWPTLLAGFVFGVCGQVHQIAACLGPPLLLAVLLQPGRRIKRSLLLIGGALLVVGLALPGMQILDPHEIPPPRMKWDAPYLEVYLHHLGVMFRDPMTVLGLVLVALGWLQGRLRGPLVRLSVLWFLLAGLALTGMLLFFAERSGPRVIIRYGLLNPPSALLSAVALTWLLGLLRRVAGRVLRWTPRPLVVLTAAALVLVGVLGQAVHAQHAAHRKSFERESARACYFGHSIHHFRTPYIKMLADDLLVNFQDPPGDYRSSFHTHPGLAGFSELVWQWNRVADQEPKDGNTNHATLTPNFTRFDLSKLPFAQRAGLLWVLHWGAPLEINPGSAPHIYTSGDHLMRPGDYLMVYINGTRVEPPRTVRLQLGKAQVKPLDGCDWMVMPCGPRLVGTFQGWYLFEAPSGVEGASLTILFEGLRSETLTVTALHLPADGRYHPSRRQRQR